MKDQADFLHLFQGEKAALRSFTVLKKSGHPILYLPANRRMADATLRLYPAQRVFARSMVTLLRGFLRLGLPFSRQEANFPIDEDAAFSVFLKRVIPGSKTVPLFGILANRFKDSGRPYILVLFDDNGQPAAVVKVGTSKEARGLIRVEQELFFPERPHFSFLPEARDWYEGEEASAIAYRYVEGAPPKPREHKQIGALLNSWIGDAKNVPINELSVWTELDNLRRDNPGLESIFQVLQSCPIKPVFSHGDFAPWNIRVTSSGTKSTWVVLDWEHGDRRGVPGWDWIHFILQYTTLVRRLSPQATLSEFESLWKNPDFQAYARQTGIEPMLKELTFVFLYYFLRYCNPRENAAATRMLLWEFKKRYFGNIAVSEPRLTISVITPSYKQLPWLKLCAASVADQEGVIVEHIIQDAQSGPELEEWIRKNTKAKLHVECDAGMYDAINRGFSKATGDIVCWLNSDEQYLEGTLAKVARYFEVHPEIDILFGDALLVSNTGALLSYRRTIAPNVRHIQAVHLNTLSCATFFRRSVLEQGFKLNTRWRAIADGVLIADLLRADIPMAVMNEPLAVFTITDSNLGMTSLAQSEVKLWRKETASDNLLVQLYFTGWHRFIKLLHGAYWPRSVTTRLYTLESPQKRVAGGGHYVGFSWPKRV
jgi:glycosyltransferase involved in cell wall biosynthesis